MLIWVFFNYFFLFKHSWYTKYEFKMKDFLTVFEHADRKENFKVYVFYYFYFILCKLISTVLVPDCESENIT